MSKCGCPMLKLTGFFIFAARSNTLRIPEASILCIRSAIQDSLIVDVWC